MVRWFPKKYVKSRSFRNCGGRGRKGRLEADETRVKDEGNARAVVERPKKKEQSDEGFGGVF